MNVEDLRSVQRTERQKDSLQHLRDSFYRDVADYIAERKAERERVAEQADDPYSSPEVKRITDEIETAEEVVESIYERRIGKIVKRATFAAAGMATEDEGLTHEERDLFDDLVGRIERNRETVLDTLAAAADDADDDVADEEATGPVDSAPTPALDSDSAPDPAPAPAPDSGPNADGGGVEAPDPTPAPDADDLLAEAMGGGDSAAPDESEAQPSSPTETPAPDAPDESPAPDGGDAVASAAPAAGPGSEAGEDTDRTTLRITRDVGEIFGVDEREYDLASEDVVTLPTPNAEPLLDRDAAERLDYSTD
jgi:DNA replication factor GINS